MFTLKFNTTNAAFSEYPEDEITRILRGVIEKVRGGFASGTIMDINGNTIGEWKLED